MPSTQLYHLSKSGAFKPCAAALRSCPLGSHLTAQQLGQLGYDVPLTREQKWRQSLDSYAAFRAEHNREPHSQAVDADEAKLGKWLMNSKQAASGTGTGSWSPERTAAIAAVNPAWDQRQRAKTLSGKRVSWEERYSQLQDWHAEHGHLPSTRETDPETKVLATWLNAQRQLARGHYPGTAPADQEARLALIDPNWNPIGKAGKPYTLHWGKRLSELDAFTSEHKRLPDVASSDESEAKLAKWVVRQRNADLTGSQLARLDTVASGWNVSRRGPLTVRPNGVPEGATPTAAERKLALLQTWLDADSDHSWLTISSAPKEVRDWLSGQRFLLKSDRINETIQEALDRVLPNWRAPLRRGRPPKTSKH